ncbi:hypothetical protein VYU27_010435, partial [Nannochloropsis oceanica]
VDLKAEIIAAAIGGRGGGYSSFSSSSSSSSYPFSSSSSSSSYPSSNGRGSAADFAAQRRKKMKLAKMEDGYQERLAVMRSEQGRGYSLRTLESMAAFDEDEIPHVLIEALVRKIDHEEGPGAILIFLPGWEDISKLHESLQRLPQARNWRLYPLHSQLPMDQQREIFAPPPPGLRKIVLATNVAESSITIDDVVFVLDGGKHKEKTYDAEKKLCMLLPAWVSRASAIQRK